MVFARQVLVVSCYNSTQASPHKFCQVEPIGGSFASGRLFCIFWMTQVLPQRGKSRHNCIFSQEILEPTGGGHAPMLHSLPSGKKLSPTWTFVAQPWSICAKKCYNREGSHISMSMMVHGQFQSDFLRPQPICQWKRIATCSKKHNCKTIHA